MAQKIGAALLSYADTIWKTADTLRGAGIKEGDFPSFMMPFFALMLLESRLRRFKAEKVREFEREMGKPFDAERSEDREWLEMSAKVANKGYHPELLLLDKGLKETCAVPGGNFRNRLMAHLHQYDPESRKLLGLGYAEGAPKFLDIQGKASDLFSRSNSPLYAFAQKWAAIDLTPFDNSEVTTIEEHIKRRWGDISAETAGEQYTPSDLIDLATELIIELCKEGGLGEGIADLYDMACGGGNFLFATEDAMRAAFPNLSVRVRGQELNDALYALAAIEARFRPDARIERENTLTNDLFLADKFDVIVANPPYGVDWKDARAAVEADASGRFAAERLPPVSDGQLLFLQHAAFHLSEHGVATVVHNGSTLFSGDAGSGESQTRLWLLKQEDLVEAIIQLPRGEFFNTDISTYMWVLNRNKPAKRRGKVLLINGEGCSTKIKRVLNKKNCEIDEAGRRKIVDAFKGFCNGPIARVVDVDDLLYNRVEIEIHRHDAEGRAVDDVLPIAHEAMRVWIDDVAVSIEGGRLADHELFGDTMKAASARVNELVKNAAWLSVDIPGGGSYRADVESGEVVEVTAADHEKALGLGRLIVKSRVAKSKKGDSVRIDVSLAPLIEKDTESTGFSSNRAKNERLIESFLGQWVHEPWGRLDERVGCEINFNRVFPKPSNVPLSASLLKEVDDLAGEMETLRRSLAQFARGGKR